MVESKKTVDVSSYPLSQKKDLIQDKKKEVKTFREGSAKDHLKQTQLEEEQTSKTHAFNYL